MKVVAFSGSPRVEGNTYHALKIVLDELNKEGIETEFIQVGHESIRGCMACGQCVKYRDEECIIKDDVVNAYIQKMKEADGILLGSPVYYSAIPGAMKAFLDRAFFVSSINGSLLRHKVGAAVAVVRRSGGIDTFEQLSNYILCSEMIVPTSNYWNVIHGAHHGEVLQDEEGIQIMRILGQNMAWVMKLAEHGKDKIAAPEREMKLYTSFIR